MAELVRNKFEYNSAEDYGGTLYMTSGVTALLTQNEFMNIQVGGFALFETPWCSFMQCRITN